MRLCIDVDDTIAKGGKPYKECVPFPGSVERMKKLRAQGHYLIYLTARYMIQCSGDRAKAHAAGYDELRGWLDKYGFPYDEIHLGKPAADFYLDDKAFKTDTANDPECWDRLEVLLG